jgi:hypothetical protein
VHADADECERVQTLRTNKYFSAHANIVKGLTDAICTHVKLANPKAPLIFSLHGPTGTGKSLFHQLLAEALYGEEHVLPFMNPANAGRWTRCSRWVKSWTKPKKYEVRRRRDHAQLAAQICHFFYAHASCRSYRVQPCCLSTQRRSG